jgi:hypothetical protein
MLYYIAYTNKGQLAYHATLSQYRLLNRCTKIINNTTLRSWLMDYSSLLNNIMCNLSCTSTHQQIKIKSSFHLRCNLYSTLITHKYSFTTKNSWSNSKIFSTIHLLGQLPVPAFLHAFTLGT